MVILLFWLPITIFFGFQVHYLWFPFLQNYGQGFIKDLNLVSLNLTSPEYLANFLYDVREHQCQPLRIKLLGGFRNDTYFDDIVSVSGLNGWNLTETHLRDPFELHQAGKKVALTVENIVSFFQEKNRIYEDTASQEAYEHEEMTEEEYKGPTDQIKCWNGFRELIL